MSDQDCWDLFSWWFRQTYRSEKKQSSILHELSYKERSLLQSRYLHAWVINGVMHLGIGSMMYTMAVSSKYMMKELSVIPYPLRLGCVLVIPPAAAYLRFSDIFYEESVRDIAKKLKSKNVI